MVKKAFTLAEALVTMAIIGIIMALSIPAVIQSTNDTKPLFKKAYNTVEEIVNELINDTSLYPSGDLSSPATGVTNCSSSDASAGLCFCNHFFSKMNTIGSATCTVRANAVTSVTSPGTFTSSDTTHDAVSTNAMKWYDVHSTTAATTSGFAQSYCDGTATDNYTTIDDTATTGSTCLRITVDVNGANKGANTTQAQTNRDMFFIYITNTGKVTVKSGSSYTATNEYDEAYILQN